MSAIAWAEPHPAPVERARRTRVLVLDSDHVVRIGLRALLGALPWVERCVGASDVTAAMTLLERYEPQLVLVDATLCREQREDVLQLPARRPDVKLVAHSGARVPPAGSLRACGAMGLISRRLEASQLVAAIERVSVAEDAFLLATPEVMVALPRREADVLTLLPSGATNREIGLRLHVSTNTVKDHLLMLYRRLGVHDRAAAVRRAQELGLL